MAVRVEQQRERALEQAAAAAARSRGRATRTSARRRAGSVQRRRRGRCLSARGSRAGRPRCTARQRRRSPRHPRPAGAGRHLEANRGAAPRPRRFPPARSHTSHAASTGGVARREPGRRSRQRRSRNRARPARRVPRHPPAGDSAPGQWRPRRQAGSAAKNAPSDRKRSRRRSSRPRRGPAPRPASRASGPIATSVAYRCWVLATAARAKSARAKRCGRAALTGHASRARAASHSRGRPLGRCRRRVPRQAAANAGCRPTRARDRAAVGVGGSERVGREPGRAVQQPGGARLGGNAQASRRGAQAPATRPTTACVGWRSPPLPEAVHSAASCWPASAPRHVQPPQTAAGRKPAGVSSAADASAIELQEGSRAMGGSRATAARLLIPEGDQRPEGVRSRIVEARSRARWLDHTAFCIQRDGRRSE